MSVIKINAVAVPEGAGPELEKRFAAHKHSVDQFPGFEGFQLLRPVKGDDRYFVVTQWASDADFQHWAETGAKQSHGGGDGQRPVASGADLLEFEVVEL